MTTTPVVGETKAPAADRKAETAMRPERPEKKLVEAEHAKMLELSGKAKEVVVTEAVKKKKAGEAKAPVTLEVTGDGDDTTTMT